MAENQARGHRTRNGARIGGGHARMNTRDQGSRLDYDERSTFAWRQLDRIAQFHSDQGFEIPDWQPRD